MTHKRSSDMGLPPELRELLKSARPADESLADLKRDVLDLDQDPEFLAGYVKAQFVQDIYHALYEIDMTKSDLAKKLKKSRQYMGRVLNETANFTIESMVSISCALGRQFVLRMLSPSETFRVFQTIKQPVQKSDFDQELPFELRKPDLPPESDFVSTPPTPAEKVPNEYTDLAA